MIRIIDDALTPEEIEGLYRLYTSSEMPYFLSKSSATMVYEHFQPGVQKRYDEDNSWLEQFEDRPFFLHPIVEDSQVLCATHNMLQEMVNRIGINNKIFRARINLVHPSSTGKSSLPHIDYPEPHLVLLYYFNDSDGDTIMYDNEVNETQRITPKAGRFVLFDGMTLHSSTPPVTNKFRVVFNINLEV